MVKYIQKLLNVLRMELVVVWISVAIAVVLGELDFIPNGVVMPQSSD